jgi:signal transduction histidine kinase
VIVGTELGKLYLTKDKGISKEKILNDVSIETINGSCFDSATNKLWIGTGYNGLLKINSDFRMEKHVRVTDNYLTSSFQIFEENRHDLWVNSRFGVIKLSTQKIESSKLISFARTHPVLSMGQSRDGSITAMTTEGVYQIKDGIEFDSINNVSFENRIFTGLEIDGVGRNWIGTWGHGLIMLDNKRKVQRIISRADGLNSDIIFNLTEINGVLYVGTPRGIDLVSISDDEKIVVRHLSDEITPTNQNTFFYESESKTLWFGSNSKCYYYNVDTPFKQPPIVTIDRITFFGSRMNDTIRTITNKNESIELRYNENNVEFQFLGISLSYPEAVTYSVRLIGWDSIWSSPNSGRTIRYHDLPPGNYQFEVVVYSPEGIQGTKSSWVEFSIKNPIWKEPWLILGSIVIIIFCALIILRLLERKRVNSVIAKEKQRQDVTEHIRKNIARDFHDNIGNKLAGLKLTSNLMRLKLGAENREVSNLLVEIERSSQDLFDGTKDFIWSIDPESDNLVEVFTYLKDFGESLFSRSHFIFHSDLTTDKNSVKIPTGWSREIVLIFKEAMTNTIKHSNGFKVSFLLKIEGSNFLFSFNDNGEFNETTVKKGKGLANMVQRSKSIGCQITLGKSTSGNYEIAVFGKLPFGDGGTNLKGL